jgi:hypothetical protein
MAAVCGISLVTRDSWLVARGPSPVARARGRCAR